MTKNSILLFLLGLLFTSCQLKLNTTSKEKESDTLIVDAFVSHVAVLQSMVVAKTLSEEVKSQNNPSLLRPNYLQRELFRGLAKKVSKGSVDLKLQSFLESNLRMQRHKVRYSSLSKADKVHIGNMLGVDALVVCEFYDGVNESDWIESRNEINRINEIVFYISMYDTRNGGLIWREKTRASLQSGGNNNLDHLAVQSIDFLLKGLPLKIEKAPGLEEITFL